MSNDKLLTVKEAADYLGLRPSTLRCWILKRKVGFVKLLGGSVRIKTSELAGLIDAGTVPAALEK